MFHLIKAAGGIAGVWSTTMIARAVYSQLPETPSSWVGATTPSALSPAPMPGAARAQGSNDGQDSDEEFVPIQYEEGSVEATVVETLNTGDVVMFNRNPYDMNPYRFVLHAMSKFLFRTSFDHCGVIVRDREDDYPYVFQVDDSGPSLRLFDEALIGSSAREIVVKRLVHEPGKAKLDAVDNVVQRYLKGEDEESKAGWNVLFRTLFGFLVTPHRSTRVETMGRIAFHEGKIEKLRGEVSKWRTLDYDAKSKEERVQVELMRQRKVRELVGQYRVEQDMLRKEKRKFLKRKDSYLLNFQHKKMLEMPAISPSAEAVASVLMALEVLPKEVPTRREYLPRHFMKQEYVPLLGECELLPDVFLRSGNKGAKFRPNT